MGLRPRTARRLALAGAIVFLLVLGLAVAFTLPKFQNRRQLESFQQEGMLAHEEGRHGVAVQLLGRHLRGMGDRPVDPATRLAFARSRAELEVSDGGHLPAAIAVYRVYLQDRPDDREAAAELLQLFVSVGQWVEARELSGRLRGADPASASPEDLPVLRLEIVARLAINGSDPQVEQIEDRLLAEEPPLFVDVWRAYTRAIAGSDLPRADAIVSRYTQSDPESLGAAVIEAVVGSDGLPLEEAARALSDVIGVDPESGASTRDIPLRDDELTRALVLLAGSWRQEPMLLGILDRAIASSDNPDFARLLARRRYWAGRGGDVLTQPTTTPGGRVVADVLGYAALAHFDRGEADQVGAVLDQLEAISDDFRASGWGQILQARQQTEAGQLVDARASATKAVEAYPFEPTFRFVLGDIHDRMGRLADAADAWALASELAGPGVWTAPGARRVLSLLRAGRAAEAGAAADELVATVRESGSRRTVVEALIVQLQVNAQLATLAQLDRAAAEESMQIARALRDAVPGPLRTDCMLHLAAFEASIGNLDNARAELRTVMGEELSESQAARAEEIDLAFGLGVRAASSEVALDPAPTQPNAAIRLILVYIAASESDSERTERTRESLDLLADRISSGAGDRRVAWLRADAVVKSQIGHDGAADAWRSVIAAAPADVELLTEAIESEPLVYDRDFVSSSIDRVVELTATQGRTLPSRLRLAQARSVFGREPTRQSRDEALVIVRGVVVSEPENVAARTLLGNMLRAPCPPQVPASARYQPDLAGAVEQYLAASRLVGGRAAMGYLLEAAGLSYSAGNEGQTRQILSDLVAQTRTTPIARGVLARDLTKFGDVQTSSRIIEEMFEAAPDSEKAELGLFLAQLYLGSNDNARAVRVLDRVVASSPLLSRTQMVDVVSRFSQAGRGDRAAAVLEDVSRFGLEQGDAERIRAEQAILSGDLNEAAAVLRRAVESDPGDPAVWAGLVDVLFRSGNTEEAAARVEQALAVHPEDTDLRFWREMVAGNLAQAVMMRASDGSQSQSVRLAIERVESYEARKLSMDRDARLAELRGLRSSFTGNAPVLKYVFRERADLADDPASLAADAIADHRRFVEDEELLRFAAIAALRGARYDDAMRLATRLRGQTRGMTTESDLIFAQAAQAAGNHAGVVDRLATSIDAASAEPDSLPNRQIIYFYGGSAVLTGNEAAVRVRLEPVARSSAEFRSQVWIPLASGFVAPASRAESWMRAAEQMGLGGMEIRAAEAWLAMSERFPEQAEAFAANAARVALAYVAVFPDDLGAVAMAGLASQRQAEARPPETATELFAQAEEFFLRASRLQPENPNYLFTAAICADAAGRPGPAEEYYRTLLTTFAGSDLFSAAVRNNLAGLLSRENPTSARLTEALQLANQAVGFGEIGAFYGTRGWLHLARDAHDSAEADFRRVIELDEAGVEGWLGLAAVYKDSGRDAADWKPAFDRAKQASGTGGLSRELSIKGQMYGLE
jgi:tetratricopeptide (TPR) repeat protein